MVLVETKRRTLPFVVEQIGRREFKDIEGFWIDQYRQRSRRNNTSNYAYSIPSPIDRTYAVYAKIVVPIIEIGRSNPMTFLDYISLMERVSEQPLDNVRYRKNGSWNKVYAEQMSEREKLEEIAYNALANPAKMSYLTAKFNRDTERDGVIIDFSEYEGAIVSTAMRIPISLIDMLDVRNLSNRDWSYMYGLWMPDREIFEIESKKEGRKIMYTADSILDINILLELKLPDEEIIGLIGSEGTISGIDFLKRAVDVATTQGATNKTPYIEALRTGFRLTPNEAYVIYKTREARKNVNVARLPTRIVEICTELERDAGIKITEPSKLFSPEGIYKTLLTSFEELGTEIEHLNDHPFTKRVYKMMRRMKKRMDDKTGQMRPRDFLRMLEDEMLFLKA